jgi:hypothetical protein
MVNDSKNLVEIKLVRQLSSQQGFEERYFDHLKNTDDRQEAFNQTEEDYFRIFGHYRYTSYQSFCSALSNMRKKNRMAGRSLHKR